MQGDEEWEDTPPPNQAGVDDLVAGRHRIEREARVEADLIVVKTLTMPLTGLTVDQLSRLALSLHANGEHDAATRVASESLIVGRAAARIVEWAEKRLREGPSEG